MSTEPIRTRDVIKLPDDLELDLAAYELRRAGRVLKLERIPMDVLLFLIAHPGQLITREELVQKVWGPGVFLDTDNSLNGAIRKIRVVLNDDPEKARFIQTITGRGYRFIAPVEVCGSASTNDSSGLQLVTPAASPSPLDSRRLGIRSSRFAIALIALLIVAGGLIFAWRMEVRSRIPTGLRTIAVLPLDNLSGDPAQDYFVDGMTDELTTDLAKIDALRVISRTSVMRYKGTRRSLPEIARELHADDIVEGSVTRSGGRVRVTAQLIRAATDQHLWAETYERDLGDALRIQGEVAQAIAQQVRVELTPQQQARLRSAPAIHPEAYDAYLRGHYYLLTASSTVEGINNAKRYFEESIRLDPSFALAHVDLANSYFILGSYRQIPAESASRAAQQSLQRALAIDPNVGEAYDTLAMLSWRNEDWPAAQRAFDKAIALAPSYGCAHADYSSYLSFTGRRAEAATELTRSRELEPSSSFDELEASDYYQLRDYPALVKAGQKAVDSAPKGWLGHYFLGIGYEASGQPQQALSEYQKAVEYSEGDQDPTASLAHLYAVLGRKAEAEKILAHMQRPSGSAPVSAYMLATVYAGLNDKDKAFELLEKSYREKSWDIPWQIKADIRIDNLRSDPRFENLLQRLALAR